MKSELHSLLSAAVEDLARLEEYKREVEMRGKLREATAAWNVLKRGEAQKFATAKAKQASFCHFLEEISTRPGPPPHSYSDDKEVWAVIQEETGRLFRVLNCRKMG